MFAFFRVGVGVTVRKILWTFLFIFIYPALLNITYPGTTGTMTYPDGSVLDVIQFTSILSQNLRPYILANIIMNMLSLLFVYFEQLRKNTETKRIYDQIILLVMTILSITQSIILYHTVATFVADSYKRDFFLYFSIINLTSTLFIAWFNRQMTIKGIGNGITLLLSLNIIGGFIRTNKITSLLDLHKFTILDFFYVCLMIFICLIIDKLMIKAQITALTPFNNQFKKYTGDSYIEYKPSGTNTMSNILATQTIHLTSLFYDTVINRGVVCKSFVYEMVNKLSNNLNFLDAGLPYNIFVYAMLLFAFNYVYNTIYYHNASKMHENMRHTLCFLNYVRPGKETEKRLDNIAMISSVISVLSTLIVILLPKLIAKTFEITININGIDMTIMISSFVYLISFGEALYVYNTYSFNSGKVPIKKGT